MLAIILNSLRCQKGQGMVEYGLILGLVTVLVLGSLTTIGTTIQGYFSAIVSAL